MDYYSVSSEYQTLLDPKRTVKSKIYTFFWGGLVCLWSIVGYAYIIYLAAYYILNPSGEWNIIPGICCTLQEKVTSQEVSRRDLPLYIHTIGATLVLAIGPVQLLQNVYRTRIHRFTGIAYMLGCTLSSLGGMVFIYLNGTVGGPIMTLAFSLSGMLVFVFSLVTSYLAIKSVSDPRARQYHRAWAIRTYAVASSSVFYRILYYGIYPLIRHVAGELHSHTFNSPLDMVFDFAYFLIPMAIAEAYLATYYNRFMFDYDSETNEIQV
jgi:hypothetical protein